MQSLVALPYHTGVLYVESVGVHLQLKMLCHKSQGAMTNPECMQCRCSMFDFTDFTTDDSLRQTLSCGMRLSF